jgi:hypothetical protein
MDHLLSCSPQTRLRTSVVNMTQPTDDACPPWVMVWAGQVAMFGAIWRGATRPEGAPPSTLALTLDQLFGADGVVPPGELKPILDAFIDSLPGLAHEGGPNVEALFDKWTSNDGMALHAAVDSLARYYAFKTSAIRARGFEGARIGPQVPECLFEAVFFDWIRTERPAVLQRGVAMMPALLFACARQAGAFQQGRELILGLMKLRDDARSLASRVHPLALVRVLNLEQVAEALTRMVGALDEILEPLTKTSGGIGERGRPEDPIRPLEVRVLHELGLKNGDIGSLLDIKPDAVRKQLRKTKRKSGPTAGTGGELRRSDQRAERKTHERTKRR